MRRPGETLSLSRSEAARIADAMAPLIARYGSRRRTAAETGLSQGTIQAAVSRRASLRITRGTLDAISEVTGLDTRGMGA